MLITQTLELSGSWVWSDDIPPTVYTFRDYLGAQTSTETFMYRLSENREAFFA